jgi:tetratricopeptide (TPR) repeat protein
MLLFVPTAIFILHVIDYFSYKKTIQFTVVFGIIMFIIAQGDVVYSRNKIFATEFDLWQDNLIKAPMLSRTNGNFGKILLEMGNEKLGEFYTQKALDIGRYSNLQEPLFFKNNLAYLYINQKNYDKALAIYQAISMEKYALTDIYNKMAFIFVVKGKYAMAYELMLKAFNKEPYNEMYLKNLAFILLKEGKIDASINAAKQSLLLKEDFAEPLAILGEAFRVQKNYSKSIEYWESYATKKPTDIISRFCLIELYDRVQNRALLIKSVGILIQLKGEIAIEELIVRSAQNQNQNTYIINPDLVLPIIERVLIELQKESRFKTTPINTFPVLNYN